MGGIINVYTKSPLKYEGTNIWLSNGSYGYRDYALSHYKKISEKFGYALSGDYRNSDGYFTNLFTDKKADGQFLRNAGRSESKGVEVSLQGNPVNGLMVQVNYGFTHATFKDYKDERRGIDYSGNFLPMVPRHTFAVGADYTISTNYTGTGCIQWKEDNKVSQPYYGLLNAKVSATKEFITFAIWAKNMTGADYSAFYFGTGGKNLAQKGRPFTIGGNIQLNF